MLEFLPKIRYPPAGSGYWSPETATLDWCEENYYATQYSAEIVNTLTNLVFIYLAFKGIANCIRNGHDNVFLISYIGYLVVGSGSFAFHSTLHYPMQLVDELSMIYTTCIMFYASFAHRRSAAFSVVLSIGLTALALFITGYYHYLQDPVFHQTAYGILTAIVLIRSLYVMEIGLRPQWQAKERALRLAGQLDGPANGKANGSSGTPKKPSNGHANRASTSLGVGEQRRVDARDIEILQTMWTMIAFGLSIFLGGFALWNLDNIYCSKLRAWRHEVGLPWGIVLEGHGWWHVMTGIGAYFYITWGIWLRYCLNNQQDEVELCWPRRWTSFPSIERRSKASTPRVKQIKKTI